MTDRGALAALFAIMLVITAAAGGLAVRTLYDAELNAQKASLQQAVRLQADLVQRSVAVADRDEMANIYRMLGSAGVLLLGRRDGETVVYIDNQWLPDMPAPKPAPIDSDQAEPMRRALAGEQGVLLMRDENGDRVLAAFAPVPGREIGVVAKTDLSGLRGPFIASTALLGGIVLALIAAWVWLFSIVGNPIVRRIREGDHKFRELFEHMRGGAAVLRPSADGERFVVTGFNRGAERIDGISREAVLGRSLGLVLPALSGDQLLQALRRVGRTGRPEHVSASFGEEEQGQTWRECDVYKLPAGELVVLYDDVTDRKRAEEALRESEQRWRSIIAAHAQAIIIVDQKHEIRFVNNAAERLFGQTARELIGAPFAFPLVPGEVTDIEIAGRTAAPRSARCALCRCGAAARTTSCCSFRTFPRTSGRKATFASCFRRSSRARLR